MKKKNGFTLIELLAVIIILGVLMIIAIPAVTKYIEDSRKSGYVSTAKSIVGGARNLVYSGELGLDDKTVTYYIDGKCISTDNGYKSPYGELEKAYVAVVLDGDNYEYYWMSVDSTNTGVDTLKNANELDVDDIVGDIDSSKIEPNIGIDKRKKIIKIEGENCVKSAPETATRKMNTKTGKIGDPCPSVTDTIYWAINNNKLILSDSEVSGTSSGNFPATTEFAYRDFAPWLSDWRIYEYISEIEVVGTVAPLSTAYWFYGIGSSSQTLNVDLSNLEVCNVTNMEGMFSHIAEESSSFSMTGLDSWDTSEVINMKSMFESAAKNVSEANLDLSNWIFAPDSSNMFNYLGYYSSSLNLELNNSDASNLSNAGNMFYQTGYNATNWSINGINNWKTPNLTNMNSMFDGAGYKATSIDLDLSSWDVSKVVNMTYAFRFMGYNGSNVKLILKNWDLSRFTTCTDFYDVIAYIGVNATSVYVDLSNWNVSNSRNLYASILRYIGNNSSLITLNLSNWKTNNLVDIVDLFNNFGQNAVTINIDISGWNTSKVTRIDSLFNGFGENATNITIIIPSTNGNGINNTTSTIYGSSLNDSYTLSNGIHFTLAS